MKYKLPGYFPHLLRLRRPGPGAECSRNVLCVWTSATGQRDTINTQKKRTRSRRVSTKFNCIYMTNQIYYFSFYSSLLMIILQHC
jgi:hypothetical protein